MAREMMNDLAAFLAVAREQSFTRAAASLDVSTSALSHAMRRLEKQVGVRLLSRTTRNSDAVTMRDPSRLKAADHTWLSWPRSTAISLALAASQIRAVLSRRR